jgi:BCD family chlorophyll transporter-like MFS transporter
MRTANGGLGWVGIVRLGLVQACLGGVVVLATSTLNRIMVVELALPALVPGVLVALHYVIQVVRPRMGFGSDVSRRRTPWVLGGMVLLATGAVLAAAATVWMRTQPAAGFVAAMLAFAMIGVGVSASGTSLLAMLATAVAPGRRAAAATIVWMMMIAGFAVTAGLAGRSLDPYSDARLIQVTAAVAVSVVLVAALAMAGIEARHMRAMPPGAPAALAARPSFMQALREVWAEPPARRFTGFIFVSMLAYSAQDLILEPFAGAFFGFTPGESTQLSAVQHAGVLLGMITVALVATRFAGHPLGSLRLWSVGGCLASALALALLAAAGMTGAGWPLRETVFLLGVANGAFAIAAVGSMMGMASQGHAAREGTRMGLWGAAQALAFGLGGLVGTAASDVAHWWLASPGRAYAAVFALEAVLFVLSALIASRVVLARRDAPPAPPSTRQAGSVAAYPLKTGAS